MEISVPISIWIYIHIYIYTYMYVCNTGIETSHMVLKHLDLNMYSDYMPESVFLHLH